MGDVVKLRKVVDLIGYYEDSGCEVFGSYDTDDKAIARANELKWRLGKNGLVSFRLNYRLTEDHMTEDHIKPKELSTAEAEQIIDDFIDDIASCEFAESDIDDLCYLQEKGVSLDDIKHHSDDLYLWACKTIVENYNPWE